MTAKVTSETVCAATKSKLSIKAKRRLRDIAWNTMITVVCIVTSFAIGTRMRIVEPASPTLMDFVWASLFFFSVLVNAGWLFCIFTPLVRKRLLNAICFMMLFVWGCVLYFYYPVDKALSSASSAGAVAVLPAEQDATARRMEVVMRQIESPNRTVAAFFPSRGGFESITKDGAEFSYFIFHTLVLFYVVVLMFAVFGRGLVNRLRKWMTPWHTLNVFWGMSDAGLLLARSILGTSITDRVFFALQQRSGDGDEWRTVTNDIDQMGATWSFTYDSNAIESDVGRDTLSQTKGRRHFFMDPSGHVNISRADRLVKVLRNDRPKPGLKGFWQALCAGMIVRWFKDYKRWWKCGVNRLLKRISHHCKTLYQHPNWLRRLYKEHDKWWRCRKVDVWGKPYFYVRVEASADELVYLEWAANVRDVVVPILVREARLISKDFIARYPLLAMPGIKLDQKRALVREGSFRILILGFGSCGQELLSEIVCNGQFLKDEKGQKVPAPFSVDIVEQDEKVVEEYCIRHHTVEKEYHVDFIKGVRIEDKSFDEWFRGKLKDGRLSYNRVIVCLKGDDLTLSIATKVIEFSRRHGVHIAPGVVFARVTDPARHRYMPHGVKRGVYSRGADIEVPITVFGNLAEIYSFGRIDAEAVDKMAKVLDSRHGDFGREVADDVQMEKDWDAASVFDQLSSRAAAEGQRNLLGLLGLRYASTDHGGRVVSAESLASLTAVGSEVLDTLSITEHMRWNAFHVMQGYRTWDVLRGDVARSDLPEPRPARIKANQLASIGKHADIVPFDKLPDVDMKLAEWNGEKGSRSRDDFVGLKEGASQAWDIAFCQIMNKVAAAAGFSIVEA